MIIGIFLRHYGTYKNINYIPISNGETFTSIIGDNGAGKSTILDALDKFINKRDTRDWPINKQARQEGGISSPDKIPFIAPVFLIPKTETENLSKALNSTVKFLSHYFWNISPKSQFEEFFNHRESLKAENLEQTHNLLLFGKNNEGKESFFFSFESELSILFKKNLPTLSFQKNTTEALEKILDLYTYLYIPVETNIGSFTKLETTSMQVLMDKNIQEAVGKTITQKSVDEINAKLNKFISEIESLLPEYTYKAPVKKNKLTKLDIVQKTIEAFFSTKILHKKINKSEISIENLSSGEKRKSVIDLAYSFLAKEGERERKVILAIDEPESSLHIDACFEQFEKLHEIARSKAQIIVTTHWYGHLPISDDGRSILLTKNNGEIEKTPFRISNYREQITQTRKTGKLPYSIALKSYNDLTQSIINSLQNNYKWVICEGSSEKLYLRHYLNSKENNKLKILPVGGAPEVIRIAKYLTTPLQDKSLSPNGKIFCLIDTDREDKKFIKDSSIKCLEIKRILRAKDNIKLLEIEHTEKGPETEIEDALSPAPYLQTLREIAPEEVKRLITPDAIREDACTSAYCLDLKDSQRETLLNFFDSDGIKYKFAKRYIDVCNSTPHKTPAWIVEISEFLGIPLKDIKPENSEQLSSSKKSTATKRITRTKKQSVPKSV